MFEFVAAFVSDQLGRVARNHARVQIQHLPGAHAVADGGAVMDVGRSDGNDVAGAGLYPAASAMRDLRARADHADAELVMRVARKGVPAARSHGLHAGERAARHDELAWLHQRADRKGLALVFLHDLLDELGAADFAVLVGVHGGELFRAWRTILP
ncbi:hypothetical protein G6F50_015251 [Rhizopus delemar]|uniref:Uncharacterized protein n=1 Tax=Rhizopus delemar TaxID=936053 RepID=A0A9P7C4M4_9FUNG|nr:hypothetical protein G6F50_015251 [Rhizopus delemar]